MEFSPALTEKQLEILSRRFEIVSVTSTADGALSAYIHLRYSPLISFVGIRPEIVVLRRNLNPTKLVYCNESLKVLFTDLGADLEKS